MYVKLTVTDLGFPVGGRGLQRQLRCVAPATPPSRFANNSV